MHGVVKEWNNKNEDESMLTIDIFLWLPTSKIIPFLYDTNYTNIYIMSSKYYMKNFTSAFGHR